MSGPAVRILVVDDDAIFRDELASLLRDDGHTVEVAPSVPKAIEWLERSEADAVLTDLKMPRHSGLELLRDVRARWPRTPVVMITGYATVETALEAMKVGAFDYLRKPFRVEQVRATLAMIAQEREYDADPADQRNAAQEARRLASEGRHDVLFIGDDPLAEGPRLHRRPLAPDDLAGLEAHVDAFVGDHPNAALVLAGVERLTARHRLEDVVALLDRLNARLAGHGPFRVGFDPREVGPVTATAVGGAVAAGETHGALEALANPIRRKVLLRLDQGGASFGEVMLAAGLDDSPKMSFHLRKLADAGLIAHDAKVYTLTPRGKAGARLLGDASFLPPSGRATNLAFPTPSAPAGSTPGSAAAPARKPRSGRSAGGPS